MKEQTEHPLTPALKPCARDSCGSIDTASSPRFAENTLRQAALDENAASTLERVHLR